MTAVEQTSKKDQNQLPTGQLQVSKKARSCQTDDGPKLLPCMNYFVTLLRKSKRPALVVKLVACAVGDTLPEISTLVEAAKDTVAAPARKVIFQAIAKLDIIEQQRIEQAAERILLLADEYGVQAVRSLLDEQDPGDAAVLAIPTDKYSRALHLYLLQEYPERGTKREQRFDHAERLQAMHRQWKSESYSSHFLGPKGVVPIIVSDVEDVLLRNRIAELFPEITADQILIEQFCRRNLVEAASNIDQGTEEAVFDLLHTLTATFNGAIASFKQVTDGQVVEHEEPAAMSVCYSWEPATGALGVFCEDREMRRALAMIFRDVMLPCEGDINDMPIRQFDLLGFSTPAMLKRIQQELIKGVEKISISQIKIARPFEQHTFDEANGREIIQHLTSHAAIIRDPRDSRQIYQIAYEDYGHDDLTCFTLAQVKLVIRIAKQPHRRAHNIAVQITSPNGLNDKSKTEDDRRKVLEQLARLDILSEF
jgi:hypothetical protein